jgi:hypothetical protein
MMSAVVRNDLIAPTIPSPALREKVASISEPDEGEARQAPCGVASGTPLTLPALTRRASPSPAVQERGFGF